MAKMFGNEFSYVLNKPRGKFVEISKRIGKLFDVNLLDIGKHFRKICGKLFT